jgi:hypothetical protein
MFAGWQDLTLVSAITKTNWSISPPPPLIAFRSTSVRETLINSAGATGTRIVMVIAVVRRSAWSGCCGCTSCSRGMGWRIRQWTMRSMTARRYAASLVSI